MEEAVKEELRGADGGACGEVMEKFSEMFPGDEEAVNALAVCEEWTKQTIQEGREHDLPVWGRR